MKVTLHHAFFCECHRALELVYLPHTGGSALRCNNGSCEHRGVLHEAVTFDVRPLVQASIDEVSDAGESDDFDLPLG